MKKLTLVNIFSLIFLMVSLASCEAIKGIFKAGMWFGVIAVLLVLGLVFYIIGKLRG